MANVFQVLPTPQTVYNEYRDIKSRAENGMALAVHGENSNSDTGSGRHFKSDFPKILIRQWTNTCEDRVQAFFKPAARQANLPQLYGTLCDILKRIR